MNPALRSPPFIADIINLRPSSQSPLLHALTNAYLANSIVALSLPSAFAEAYLLSKENPFSILVAENCSL